MNTINKSLNSILITYLIVAFYLLYPGTVHALGIITEQDEQSTVDSNYRDNIEITMQENEEENEKDIKVLKDTIQQLEQEQTSAVEQLSNKNKGDMQSLQNTIQQLEQEQDGKIKQLVQVEQAQDGKIKQLVENSEAKIEMTRVLNADMELLVNSQTNEIYSISSLKDVIDDLRHAVKTLQQQPDAPAGVIMAWAGELEQKPAGWAVADGDALKCSTYVDLCAALHDGSSSYTWGESPSTGDFYLPDLRGYVLRGLDVGANLDPDCSSRTVGTTVNTNTVVGRTGCSVGSYQGDMYKQHNHNHSLTNGSIEDYYYGNHSFYKYNASGSTAGNQFLVDEQSNHDKIVLYISTTYRTRTPAQNGSIDYSGGKETRMKNAAVHYIISCGSYIGGVCAQGA
jgi:microcystin-dependent protein